MKTRRNALLLSFCAVLLVVASVFGTVAYMTSKDQVKNTFTVGKVAINLDEAKVTEDGKPVDVSQWEPYEREYTYSFTESIDAIISWLEKNGLDELVAGTRIIIVPGFRFRVVNTLITNFHQPQSTLLLLISAFVGGNWKPIYDYALGHGFRFLSYGDSSILHRA